MRLKVFEVMHQTGEYDWEVSCGPYETYEAAEKARQGWFRQDELPNMRVVQFFPPNNPQRESALPSATLLGLGLYVIEAKNRSRDKNLGTWKVVAAFIQREDAYSFFGKYHQGRTARVLSPNNPLCDNAAHVARKENHG